MSSPLTVAVLLPCTLGYCLFVRWPRERLRACTSIVHPSDLRDVVCSLADPLLVVLVGRRGVDVVSDAVLHEANLVIVPESWLRRVPRSALSARANIAAQLATAHRNARIEKRLRSDTQLALPF
jgi:hypothetical protein